MPRGPRCSTYSLFVRNVPDSARGEELRAMFSKYGPVSDVYVPLDYYTRRPRGFAYVQYDCLADAEDAIDAMDRVKFHGRELEVEMAQGDRKAPTEMRGKYGGPSRYDDDHYSSRRRSRSRGSPRRRRHRSSRSRTRSRSRDRRRRSGSRDRHRRNSSRSPARRSSRRSRSPGYDEDDKKRNRSRSPKRSPDRDADERRYSHSPSRSPRRTNGASTNGDKAGRRGSSGDRSGYDDDDDRRSSRSRSGSR